jgi:tetratricopeptide (TPR) repeat protein
VCETLRRALTLLQSCPENHVRAQCELEILLTMGPSVMAMLGHGAPEVEHVYTQARDLCREVGKPHHLFQVLLGLRHMYESRSACRQARDMGEQLLTLAQRLQEPLLLAEAHRALGSTLYFLGEFRAAQGHLARGVTLLHTMPSSRSRTVQAERDPELSCWAYLALLLWFQGYPEQAIQRCQEVLTLAREVAHPHSLAFVLVYLGWPRYLTMLAETYGRSGQVAAGLAAVAEALEAGQTSGVAYYTAELYRLQGELLLRSAPPSTARRHYHTASETAQAEACWQQALTIARQQQARSWELRAAMNLARLWQQQGKQADARAAGTALWLVHGRL